MPGGRPMSPASRWPSACARAMALSCASLIAARIRSSTTCFSDGTKIEGSMSSPCNSPLALAVTRTSPAPDSPTTVRVSRVFWNSSTLPCISRAAVIILPRSPIPAKGFFILLLLVLEGIPFLDRGQPAAGGAVQILGRILGRGRGGFVPDRLDTGAGGGGKDGGDHRVLPRLGLGGGAFGGAGLADG